MNAFCFPRFLWIFAIMLLGCSGATGQTEALEAGATATSGSSAAGAPSETAGSINAVGGLPGAGGSAAGGSAGGAATSDKAGAPSSGGATVGGSPTEPAAGAPSAGAGGSEQTDAGAAGSSPVCIPKSFDAACGAARCGKAVDGCGSEYGCGTCPQGSECEAGACATTCHALALECGVHPADGLDCGSCPDGQDCGVVAVGKCSTCAEAPNAGICPVGRPHLWKPCGGAPAPKCLKPFDQDPSYWCCP